jgi:hypothetical protein
VTNLQIYVAINISLLFNAMLTGILMAFIDAKFQGLEAKIDAPLKGIEERR